MSGVIFLLACIGGILVHIALTLREIEIILRKHTKPLEGGKDE